MFGKILIANRGEIAVRVIRAARELGVKTVAVYSDADEGALHVRLADEAVHLGPAPAAESYLDQDKLLDAIDVTGAEAVHPGYGFLAENAAFVRRLEKEGIKFIGPNSKAMAAMGDKVEAKRHATAAGVPVSPGSDGPVSDPVKAARIARDIGFPVMVKAAHGGGGIGMRVVHKEADLEAAIEGAQNQAQAAFGNPEVFIEKFIERPRHIEYQVLGDEHGHVIHLGERECSIQRRNQKLVEEAPSTVLDAATRADMGERVVNLVKRIGYTNAGTMEFLWKDGEFFFMEMNTRLQVEHPVTELVTGIDLVRWQLKIAAGEPLTVKQEDVHMRGHAIEARINAEDPYHHFAPSPGTVTDYRPPGGPGVRVDDFLQAGFTIPGSYDSMVAKLIAYGADRPMAIDRLRRALDEFRIGGVTTNIPFHQRLVTRDDFQAGEFDIGFLEASGILRSFQDEAGEKAARERRVAAAVAAALNAEPGGLRAVDLRLNTRPVADGGHKSGPSPWVLAARRASLRGGR